MATESPKQGVRQIVGMGMLVVCGIAALAIAAIMDVRYTVEGLDAVSGTVVETESINRGRTGGHELRVVLRTANGTVELRQDLVGSMAHRLRPGEAVRAWVEREPKNQDAPPHYGVWQIERGGRAVIPVAEVQDQRNTWRYLMYATGAVLLLTGLFTLGRALVRSGLVEIRD